jgi:hypothetical protein
LGLPEKSTRLVSPALPDQEEKYNIQNSFLLFTVQTEKNLLYCGDGKRINRENTGTLSLREGRTAWVISRGFRRGRG